MRRNQTSSIPVVIALHFTDDDRRLVVKDRGVLVQQRFDINGWTDDEEPWPDIAAALKRASKLIQVAKFHLELAGIEASYKQERIRNHAEQRSES